MELSLLSRQPGSAAIGLGLLCMLCSGVAVWADQQGGSLPELSPVQSAPVGTAEPASTGSAARAREDQPRYNSAQGRYQPAPLPQNQQIYQSESGRFRAPDANTPQQFNPRDPARGYHPPAR